MLLLRSVFPRGWGKPPLTVELTEEQFQALCRIDELAAEIAAVAEPLWWLGAGFGAEVMDRVRGVCKMADLKPYADIIRDDVRAVVFARDGRQCKVCRTFRDLTVDHMTPSSLGGSDDLDNLQTLCKACNSAKGRKTQAEWLEWLAGPGAYRVRTADVDGQG